MTNNSRLILELINGSSDHMTAEEIFTKLKERGHKMSMATVYNNLKTLVEDKQIVRLVFDGMPDRYDKVIRHDHLICIRCGKISDLFWDDMTPEFEKRSGGKLTGYKLTVEHVCEECVK